MDFIEIALDNLDGEAAETVGELFNRYGYGGAVIESHAPDFERITVRTVLPATDETGLYHLEAMLALIDRALPGGLPPIRKQPIGQSDWAESWKAHFHPVRVGQRFVVKPSWRDYSLAPADLLIEIDPGLAFGSGLHPTTRMCLEIMEELPLKGRGFFDVGVGSGILSIAAYRLGAGSIRAVDVDEVAIRVAQENFARNGLPPDRAEAAIGTAADSGGRQWPFIAANILAHILRDLLPDLAAALSPGGRLILSGLIDDQADDILAVAAAHRLRPLHRRIHDDWVALVVESDPT